MPRDVSLSDIKCWNGGHEWDKRRSPRELIQRPSTHLNERFAPPGIMGDSLKAPLKLLENITAKCYQRGLRGTYNWAPIIPRGGRLSDGQ